MTDREIMQMALDALEHGLPIIEDFGGKEQLQIQHKAISALYEALRAALAQPEQEEDYDAIANKQLASLKAAAKVTFEDAAVRAVHKLYNAPPQPKPETVGYLTNVLGDERIFTTKKINQYSQPLYTAPPQREWQKLNAADMRELGISSIRLEMAKAIEAKLKEKNT